MGTATVVAQAMQSPFVQAVQYTETYDGNGNSIQFLRNAPVLSVQSLTVNGSVVQQSTTFSAPGWGISDDGKSIFMRGRNFPRGHQNITVTYTAGYAEQIIAGELQAVAAGTFTVTPNQPWLYDCGVKYFSTGQPLAPVQIAPQQGQYYLNGSTYLFNAADVGAQVLLSYAMPGTPPDIELAVRKMVFLTYKRRDWEGLKSLAKPESGTTSYQTWEVDPSVLEVIRNYTRTALI
jgi:hypothetical protein